MEELLEGLSSPYTEKGRWEAIGDSSSSYSQFSFISTPRGHRISSAPALDISWPELTYPAGENYCS
jgi:hypothetical protein